MRDARYGLRGVRVGEASNPGPPRRIRDPSEAIIDSLERELIMVDSDEEPLVHPVVGRSVIPKLIPTVPSKQCVRVVEASHPGPLDTQLDSTAGLTCTEERGSAFQGCEVVAMNVGDSDDALEAHVSVAVQRVSHLAPPNDSSGVVPERRLRLVGIDQQVDFLVDAGMSARSNGGRNVVPRVAGAESVADSTQVDPESSECALESTVPATRSAVLVAGRGLEDVHDALEFAIWRTGSFAT